MHYAKDHSPPTAPVYGIDNPTLGGMERAIPSFRDFMRTVPPSTAPQLKPLPPVPQPQRPSAAPFPPSQGSSLTSNARTSRSEGSLTTTLTAWESDEEESGERMLELSNDFFLQPATYTVSNPVLSKPEVKERPVLEPRKFALLIPDPSPHSSPGTLTPAFEYETHMDFPPSPASSKPPQTPLPPIPGALSPAKLKELAALKKAPTPPSPAPSVDGGLMSPTVALSEAPLAISPFSLATPVSPSSRQWSTIRQSPPWSRDFSQYVQLSPQGLVPRSAASGADDEWEDVEETLRARKNRLSVDYHAALVDQYRELVSPSSDMFADDRLDTLWGSASRASELDEELIPLPLALRSGSMDRYDVVDRSSPFPEDHYEQPSPHSHKRKSSIRDKLPALAVGTLNMILPSQHSRKPSVTSSRSGEIPISPPADHISFREATQESRPVPRQRTPRRAFPGTTRPQSGVYAVTRVKPILKSVKKKKGKKEKEQPKEPPLTLTLTSSLSTNNSSSTRPSMERGRSTTAEPSHVVNRPGYRSPSAASSAKSPKSLSHSLSRSNQASAVANPPAPPSPLVRGLTHTELFSLSTPPATPPPTTTTTGASGKNKPVPSSPRPEYPRKLSTGPPPLSVTASSHRRQKSSSTARAALNALRIGGGSGSRTAGRKGSKSSLSPATSTTSGGDGAGGRLLFVHEKLGGAGRSAVSLSSSGGRSLSSSGEKARGGGERARSRSRGSLTTGKGGGGGTGVGGSSDAAQPPQHQQMSLMKRAVEAHRNHRRERQKAEMKKSIRVLGQTDPQVVEGYVRVASGAVAGPGVRPIFGSGSGSGGAAAGTAQGGAEGWL